jgi:death-on-curing protein
LIVFLGVNGRELTMTNDEAYNFIVAISAGDLDGIPAIAARIRMSTRRRTRGR